MKTSRMIAPVIGASLFFAAARCTSKNSNPVRDAATDSTGTESAAGDSAATDVSATDSLTTDASTTESAAPDATATDSTATDATASESSATDSIASEAPAADSVATDAGCLAAGSLTVTNSGMTAYVINGQSNPTLTLCRGATYTFAVNAVGHPFYIKTIQGNGTGNTYDTGVTGNGATSGNLVFVVPQTAPATLYYDCSIHAAMTGVINIVP